MTARPAHSTVIHVEGMDLAGKSTVTNFLCGSTNRMLQRNSLVPDNPVYVRADELRRASAGADVLGTLYVDALRWDLDHLGTDSARVQDSTILLRSLAFNSVRGRIDVVRALEEMIPEHPVFGVTVVLTASIDARLGRLAERRRLAPHEVAPDDLMVITEPAVFLEMEAALSSYAVTFFDAVEVDTSHLTKAGVRDAVTRVLAAAAAKGPVAR